ncbi:MAG TPA: MopE-related protein, partial [Candidatus Nanoarchaeia archaeon]|nr:MopE-related protein [Candidatus Nanoarchaeia archaeon]
MLVLAGYADSARNCPSYADSTGEFEGIVRSALLEFLGNTESERINSMEINDLSTFYSSYKESWGDADCLSVGKKSKETIKFILEKYTAIYEGSACKIISREWSENSVYDGVDVTLNVGGGAECNGLQVGFLIMEDDFLSGDDGISASPANVLFDSSGLAKAIWKTEWQADPEGLGNNPEYYFKTIFSGQISKEKSRLLNVLLCKDEDGDGSRDISCGGADCDDKDPGVKPGKTEICNDKDDDSNAEIPGYSACAKDNGLESCACNPGVDPKLKTKGGTGADDCDNFDNDCDGDVDEDRRQAEGSWWEVCQVDFDGDKCAGVNDFIIFMNSYGKKEGDIGWNPVVDLYQTGSSNKIIDIKDFNVFAAVFTGACPKDKKCSETAQPDCGVSAVKGICNPGKAECFAGVWAVVNDIYNPLFSRYCKDPAGLNTAPTARIETSSQCDDLDNNCDGSTDEELKRKCVDYTGDITGTRCGSYMTCDASCPAVPGEVCDNRDNNCDGVVDGSIIGGVPVGVPGCQCFGGVPSQNDLCDNIDNNCNGKVDEDVRLANEKWWEVCRVDFTGDKCVGVHDFIVFGRAWDSKPGDANWDARMDFDNDKVIDHDDFVIFGIIFEGACASEDKCSPDGTLKSGSSCGSGVGECGLGQLKCTLGSYAPAGFSEVNNAFFTKFCTGGMPGIEICDNKDNNCNGQVDEGVKNACGGCGTVPAEVCDNLDNDCDGVVDEDLTGRENGLKHTCYTKSGGACLPYLTCSSCPAMPTETCNNLDDDCVGGIDNGVLSCQCNGGQPSSSDPCDTIDNNCNGVIDEDKIGSTFGACSADFNHDGCVGVYDFIKLGEAWLSEYGGTRWNDAMNYDRDEDDDGIEDGPEEMNQPVDDRQLVQTISYDDFNIFAKVFEGNCPLEESCSPDGTLKEGSSCGIDTGECSTGELKCNLNKYAPSTGFNDVSNPFFGYFCTGVVPRAEVCDNKDNNCDGRVDETWLPPAGVTTGVYKGLACGGSSCKNQGTYACNGDGTGLICSGETNKERYTLCDDDKLFCTLNYCESGACIVYSQNTCTDANDCTTDSCDEANDV